MLRTDAMEEYGKAQKLGQKDYREKMLRGQSPFLPVLDEILRNVQVENQLPLGLVEIPIKLVVGTKTAGRTAAFASNFMPLLDLKSRVRLQVDLPLHGPRGRGHPRPHPLL